jgi:hypothetical protein
VQALPTSTRRHRVGGRTYVSSLRRLTERLNALRLVKYLASVYALGSVSGTTYALFNQKASTPMYMVSVGVAGKARSSFRIVSGAVPGYPRFAKLRSPGRDASFRTRLDPTTNVRVGRLWKTASLKSK